MRAVTFRPAPYSRDFALVIAKVELDLGPNDCGSMSALGQKGTFHGVIAMSALLQKRTLVT